MAIDVNDHYSEQDGQDLIEDAKLHAKRAKLPLKDTVFLLMALFVVLLGAIPICFVLASDLPWPIRIPMCIPLGFILWFSFEIWRGRRDALEYKIAFEHISQKLRLKLDQFRLTTVCRSPVFKNLKYGTSHGVRFAIFDYQFALPKVGTFCQTVVWLHWQRGKLPDFAIGPGSWLGQDLLDLLTGRNDFHFESHPTFSKSHQIRGGNVSAIRELFTEDVLTFYEQHSGLSTEVSGKRLLYYRIRARVEPDDIQVLLNEALELLALLQPANDEGIPNGD